MTNNDEFEWKVEGKKFNKRKVAQIPEDVPFNKLGELMASGGGIFDSFRKQIRSIKKTLSDKGFDAELGVPIFRGRYFAKYQSNEQKIMELKKEGLLIENDSMEDWAVALWGHAEIALNDNIALEHRISSSCEVGRLRQVMVTYAEYGKSQSKAAQQPRLNESVLDILKKLARKEDSKKQLWDNFLGELDSQQMSPRESMTDMSKLQVSYTPNEGGDEKTMTFKTFCNRIAKIQNAR